MPISLASICLEKTALLSFDEQDRPKNPKRIGSRPDPMPDKIREMMMNGSDGTQRYTRLPASEQDIAKRPIILEL